MLSLSGYSLLTHKLGEKLSDCQDYIGLDGGSGFGAIADGATESFESRRWAQCLVEEYLKLKCDGVYTSKVWLDRAKLNWENGIRDRISQGQASVYLRNSFTNQDAAFSTFVGFTVSSVPGDSRLLIVDVEAIGDSCFFHFSHEGYVCFPLASPAAFTDRPESISSRSQPEDLRLASKRFTVREKDILVLATDAFSKFLMDGLERQDPSTLDFFSLRTQAAIADFIRRNRDSKDLQNDDIALAFLTCKAGDSEIADFTFSAKLVESDREPAIRDRALTPLSANVFSPQVNKEIRTAAPDVKLSRGVTNTGGNTMVRQGPTKSSRIPVAYEEAAGSEDSGFDHRGKFLKIYGCLAFLAILSFCMMFGLVYQHGQIEEQNKQIDDLKTEVAGLPTQEKLDAMRREISTIPRPPTVERPQELAPQPAHVTQTTGRAVPPAHGAAAVGGAGTTPAVAKKAAGHEETKKKPDTTVKLIPGNHDVAEPASADKPNEGLGGSPNSSPAPTNGAKPSPTGGSTSQGGTSITPASEATHPAAPANPIPPAKPAAKPATPPAPSAPPPLNPGVKEAEKPTPPALTK